MACASSGADMHLQDLLNSTYGHYGMGPREFNCWGLVRAGLHGLFGVALLPAFGEIHPDNKAGMTGAWRSIRGRFEECQPEAGAMACCYEGNVLMHVGLVIKRRGQLWMLHTVEGSGPVQTAIRHAALLAQRVRYYRYVGVAA